MVLIIVGLLVLSFSMFIYSMNRYKTFKLLDKEEKEKYIQISKIAKENRSEDDQDFYYQTQESFYSLLVSKYSFLLAGFLTLIYAAYLFFAHEGF